MVIEATTVTFDSIQVGDKLPSIQKTESQETINGYAEMGERIRPRQKEQVSLHTDVGFAQAGIFAGTVNIGVTTCAYVVEMLQLAFPTKSILNSTFSMRALEPFRPGDNHAAQSAAALNVRIIIDFDALWRGLQIESIGHAFKQTPLGRRFCHAAAERLFSVGERIVDEGSLFALLRCQDCDLVISPERQGLGNQVRIG